MEQVEILNLVEEHKRIKLFEDPKIFKMKFEQMCMNLDGSIPNGSNKSLEIVRQVYSFCKRIATYLTHNPDVN